jgi:5,6,7,8-tetrahydromethanopterin hydro-lyase
VAEGLRSAAESDARIDLVEADLEDLESVRRGAEEIAHAAAGRRVRLLVENAGIWPRIYATTRQGHEIAFGVNVLAHFVLRRDLAAAGVLDVTRVVMLTGDIYILASACTPDFRWNGALGGMRAYCRSKLGNLWMAAELLKRSPAFEVRVVHPGVVATNLGGDAGAVGNWFKRRFMISPEQGAQMPLICATQAHLESGGYWHNVHGRMQLAPDDPARDVDGRIGEAWSGEAPNGSHINLVIARRGSPTAAAVVGALAAPRPGHVPFLACVEPGVVVRPTTVVVNKSTIDGDALGRMTWGAAQLGIAQGVLDAVADGVLEAKAADELVLLVAVWVDPSAHDEAAVKEANRNATRAAVADALTAHPSSVVLDVAARREQAHNAFFGEGG